MVSPSEIYVIDSQHFNITLRVIDETGKVPINQTPFSLTLIYIIDSESGTPESLATLNWFSSITDNKGIANFLDCHVNKNRLSNSLIMVIMGLTILMYM